MVLSPKTTAMSAITAMPKWLAAKNAGMPSTIGEEPRIKSNAIRAPVLCLCS